MPVGLKKRLSKDIAIVSVNERKSAELNRHYRGKNKPANVLSFRYGPEYGEIIICSEVIRRDAKKAGRPYRLEVKRMIAHGLLHLAGLHHEQSKQLRKRFEKLEQKIARQMTKN